MLLEICDHSASLALDSIFKAQSEEPPGLWEPHQNPYIARIVEMFTDRGLTRIQSVNDELREWLAGRRHRGTHERPPRPSGAMGRWSQTELGITKLYLESLRPEEFTFEDWSLLVDYLVQRYLPADDLRSDVDWLATRASMMGRVEAARVGRQMSRTGADAALAALPESPGSWGETDAQATVMSYGRAHCAENVVAFTDAMRHRLKRTVMADAEARMLGARVPHGLETKLFDEFGTLNRDWRRIAVTEAGEIANQGLILALKPGRKVKRIEKYNGACAFCRSIDGKVMEVIAADSPTKDWDKQVWAGKSNVGRSASPRRADGTERPPEERWTIAAGLMHPNCRGRWIPLAEPARDADPVLSRWMDEYLGRI